MDDFISLIDERIKKSNASKSYLKSIPCRVISITNDSNVLVESVIDKTRYSVPNFSGSSLDVGENVQLYYKENIINGAYIGACINKNNGDNGSSLNFVEGDAYIGELFSDYRVIGECSFKCSQQTNCVISFNYVMVGNDSGNVMFKFTIDDSDLDFIPIISTINNNYYSGSFTVPCTVLNGGHFLEVKAKGSGYISSMQLNMCGHGIESDKKPYDPTTGDDYLYDTNNNVVSIIRYLGNKARPSVPSEIEGLPVRRLYTTAFNYSNVEAVYIPDSVIEIQ